ncbi:hypothetical protein [uncultured Cytophaga sp.]|uniref:hypothetical protein n=1 Tax=uncultured Cytophaga sp. TaxID=160238 RepID=UPI002621A4EB|nr:hypothetical protein [uncultured Cytophaga sp.]
MDNATLSPEKRIRWLAKVYFGVLDSPIHDVNPFEDIQPFLEATVSKMEWRIGGQSIEESKSIFCKHFMRVLDLYDFNLSEEEIMKCINNPNMINRDVVAHFASVGKFNS